MELFSGLNENNNENWKDDEIKLMKSIDKDFNHNEKLSSSFDGKENKHKQQLMYDVMEKSNIYRKLYTFLNFFRRCRNRIGSG